MTTIIEFDTAIVRRDIHGPDSLVIVGTHTSTLGEKTRHDFEVSLARGTADAYLKSLGFESYTLRCPGTKKAKYTNKLIATVVETQVSLVGGLE